MKANIIPHFDLLNNPAICCSLQGGIICDEDFESNHSSETDPRNKLLKTWAYYYKDIQLSEIVTNEIKLSDNQTINDEGIFHTLFLLCSNKIMNDATIEDDHNSISRDSLVLNGVLSYTNPDGYLSADDLYYVDLYLFFNLIYFILSLFWIYKMIMNYNNIKLFSKMLTFSLPIIILEKMMNLQIYSDMNRFGEINNAFEIISNSCNILKNVNYRLILFGLSSGYSILYSENLLAFVILSLFFLHMADFYLLWKIYKGFRKQIKFTQQSNSNSHWKFYKDIFKVLRIPVAIWILYVLFLTIEKMFSDSEIVWRCKWIVDTLYETVALIVFAVLVIFLQSSLMNEDEGYVQELETNSKINNYNVNESASVDIK